MDMLSSLGEVSHGKVSLNEMSKSEIGIPREENQQRKKSLKVKKPKLPRTR